MTILSSKNEAAVLSTGVSGGWRGASVSGASPGKIVAMGTMNVGTGVP